MRGNRLFVDMARPKRNYKWKGRYEGQRRRGYGPRKENKEWRSKGEGSSYGIVRFS